MPTRRKRDTTETQLAALKRTHHSVCEYPTCTAPATHVDYIVPLEQGGNPDWHNMQSHCTAHQGGGG